MTTYLMYQAGKQRLVQPGKNVHVSNEAWHTPCSRMYIQPGMPVTVTQLTHGLVIDGGHDTAIAIAETVASSVMGLHRSHFTNLDGLLQFRQFSTTRDLAHLSECWIQSYPQVLQRAGSTVAKIHNADWSPESVQGIRAGPAVVSEPKQQKAQLQTRVVPTPGLKSLFAAGAGIGTLQISWCTPVLKSVPVQAQSVVKPAGCCTRLIHEGESRL